MKDRAKQKFNWVFSAMLVVGIGGSNNLQAQAAKKLVAISPPPMVVFLEQFLEYR
jgi:hypothetical protein